ncbi:MAG: TfuA-like protein [Methanosaeta sp. PtaB.Bin039]|mgnify:CR=1 FL=1|nr:MAG: TfuA-like protein [Methanosaeta sp. PtaB.Bin039]HOT07679.1 TfuA-related McrA-glycine thioamidation protein [Methanotrichaceae archaeon]HQF17520.1 TfuA-related McrA-glycine thioamidation protein [Methanotrichaceae archaeon]HQI92075.1 TfuA-related McrA-glycine thioamidation protein [Methanotrichaceae archaeon]HQJ29314.1 TfuA-related McrA-glycine thioamidation protein [Methanotrichaceae archaeon]
MPRVVVFLGPSLPLEQAQEVLEAEFRPPARRGDLLAAARRGADLIGLIDGVFFQDCSVAHKEILDALGMGVKVVGASSMGALRAAEMDRYGMEGIGEIYQAFRTGRLVSDDEVALTFDPVTFVPLSEPLVNIRHNLRLAQSSGYIDPEAADALLQIARSLYFPRRTYQGLLAMAESQVPGWEKFRDFLEREPADLKAEDALLALKRLSELAGQSSCQP